MTFRLLALCLSVALLTSCGEEPSIEEFGITPSPITAPTGSAPTAFRSACVARHEVPCRSSLSGTDENLREIAVELR